MQSRFTYDPTGTPSARDYLTDQVSLSWEVDGDEYALLSGTVEVDVRRVRVVVEVSQVWEQMAGTDTTAGQLWLDLLKGTTVRFFPDATDAATYMDVLPDVRHRATMLATRLGTKQRGMTLRFVGKTWYAPADAMLAKFAALTPLTG